MSGEMVRVVVKRVGEDYSIEEIPNALEAVQAIVGYIQDVPFVGYPNKSKYTSLRLLFDEEGGPDLKNLPINSPVPHRGPVYGNFIVTKNDLRTSSWTGLTEDEAKGIVAALTAYKVG